MWSVMCRCPTKVSSPIEISRMGDARACCHPLWWWGPGRAKEMRAHCQVHRIRWAIGEGVEECTSFTEGCPEQPCSLSLSFLPIKNQVVMCLRGRFFLHWILSGGRGVESSFESIPWRARSNRGICKDWGNAESGGNRARLIMRVLTLYTEVRNITLLTPKIYESGCLTGRGIV